MKRAAIKRTGIRRRSKYGVRIDAAGVDNRTYGGVVYDSLKEAKYARDLDVRLRCAGPLRIKSWRRQVPVPLEVNGMLVCKMIVDFELTHMDGRTELVETKGFPTETWRLKDRLRQALGIAITVVR